MGKRSLTRQGEWEDYQQVCLTGFFAKHGQSQGFKRSGARMELVEKKSQRSLTRVERRRQFLYIQEQVHLG